MQKTTVHVTKVKTTLLIEETFGFFRPEIQIINVSISVSTKFSVWDKATFHTRLAFTLPLMPLFVVLFSNISINIQIQWKRDQLTTPCLVWIICIRWVCHLISYKLNNQWKNNNFLLTLFSWSIFFSEVPLSPRITISFLVSRKKKLPHKCFHWVEAIRLN